MKGQLPAMALAAALGLAAMANAGAAGFIKFDGVDGESRDKKHKEWIDVLSVSWGQAQPARATRDGNPDRPLATGRIASPGGGGPGSLTITKPVDKSSPRLQEASVKGTRFRQVTFDAAAAGNRQGNVTYTLSDVVVSSYRRSADGSGRAVEELSLNYGKVSVRPAPAAERAGGPGGKKGNVETEFKVEKGEK